MSFNKQLAFGGECKDKLYDKTIPSFLKKYGKKWNAKVYDDVINNDPTMLDIEEVEKLKDMPVTIIEITPEMKQSVQETPQALFSYFGGTVLGAELVSDTIQNNIISEQTN